ncbi:MAG TPA: hypothetical protein DEB40_01760 [Elusimicrobia bacterium]|nr:hypothetical protein [Elusimicrobiota bacterium]
MPGLTMGQDHQRQEKRAGQRDQGLAGSGNRKRAMRHRVERPPDQDQKNPDEGNICIPVGHALQSHLHQTDDRDQGAQIPEPTHRDIRPALDPARGINGYRGQKRQGSSHMRGAQSARGMRIKNREVRGPYGLEEIARISNDGIADARVQRQLFALSHGARLMLREIGRETGSRGQQTEWSFLRDASAQ